VSDKGFQEAVPSQEAETVPPGLAEKDIPSGRKQTGHVKLPTTRMAVHAAERPRCRFNAAAAGTLTSAVHSPL
jgi:hypothetical protein